MEPSSGVPPGYAAAGSHFPRVPVAGWCGGSAWCPGCSVGLPCPMAERGGPPGARDLCPAPAQVPAWHTEATGTDAPLCSLSWMAKVCLKRVWSNAKSTDTPLCDGPQAAHLCGVETLLFGSLTLRGSRYPCYKYIYVCVCAYMYTGIQMYMLCLYTAIYAKFQELE